MYKSCYKDEGPQPVNNRVSSGTDNESEGGGTKNGFGRLGGALHWGGVHVIDPQAIMLIYSTL